MSNRVKMVTIPISPNIAINPLSLESIEKVGHGTVGTSASAVRLRMKSGHVYDIADDENGHWATMLWQMFGVAEVEDATQAEQPPTFYPRDFFRNN